MNKPVQVPAAHSMDSSWYAVDETGEVARFETGEPGAFPENAGLSDGEAAQAHDAYALFYLRALVLSRRLDAEWPDELTRDAPEPGYVLAAFDDLSTDVSTWDLVVVHQKRCLWAISTGRLTAERATKLAGVARATFSEGSAHFYEGEGGITLYGCDNYDVPGQYDLQERPEQPILASELPEAIRAQVSKLTLPLKFSDTKSVQLAALPGIGELAVWGDVPPQGLSDEERSALEAALASRAARSRKVARASRMLLAIAVALLAVWFILSRRP